jgi:hypothetical protein
MRRLTPVSVAVTVLSTVAVTAAEGGDVQPAAEIATTV